ncbi:MAG TPA: histidine--tRNA ligase [Planctomycetia bacterium]|nr:histidine--tRNA ligase [Planctomycetia bacterium]
MAMEKIPGVKYMRDFYPDEMRLRGWIEDHWRKASLAAGFAEWDAPILENLDLYLRKSGAEIVGQLFNVVTQGEQKLAIRPEMTPSLARMIAAKQAALPRPIKWFCISRMCRYERGQRGRLREFWQWNADVLGLADAVADAETISVAIDALAAMGLTDADIEVRLNSRTLLAALLAGLGVPEEKHAAVYAVADKRGKANSDDLARMYAEIGLDADLQSGVENLLASKDLLDVERVVVDRKVTGHEGPLADLQRVFSHLAALGKANYCKFDIGIVRGLAYYTGPVYEIFDKRGELRALAGGGRYDNLLGTMGGQAMPAVGFGMGDVVLGELLKDLGKLPAFATLLDYYAIPMSTERIDDALAVVATIRGRGKRADYAPAAGNLGKAFKRADAAGAAKVVLVGGAEWEAGQVKVKDMKSGEEQAIALDVFLQSA